jgi:hypothetical protein
MQGLASQYLQGNRIVNRMSGKNFYRDLKR